MSYSKERILKNRIYVLIGFSLIVFLGAARLLKPYEKQYADLSGFWVVMGITTLSCISLLLEYLAFKLLNKYLYKV